MYGEKFIKHKIEGNKIIRISEFKNFDYDFLSLIQDLNDRVTDDWEALSDRSIYFNLMEEFSTFDADMIFDWIGELITDSKDDEDEDYTWLEEWIKPLEEAKGFIIHLNYNPEWSCHKAEQDVKKVNEVKE